MTCHESGNGLVSIHNRYRPGAGARPGPVPRYRTDITVPVGLVLYSGQFRTEIAVFPLSGRESVLTTRDPGLSRLGISY